VPARAEWLDGRAWVDGRTREGREWHGALLAVYEALAGLGLDGRAVRVRTRRDVWWMTPEDAEDLLAEAREALEDRECLAREAAAEP
jgi:hypothetical protein